MFDCSDWRPPIKMEENKNRKSNLFKIHEYVKSEKRKKMEHQLNNSSTNTEKIGMFMV